MESQAAKADLAKARLLFVDDEKRVLNAMRAMFRREYEVYLAPSGAAALQVLADVDIDVVVSDQRMPEMTGVEVLTRARELVPHTMRVLLTGYADLEAIETAINGAEVFRYLMKPCARDELKATVQQAVDAARASRAAAATPAAAAAVRAPEPVPSRPVVDAADTTSDVTHVPGVQASGGVDLLVLSGDTDLHGAIRDAIGAGGTVHAAMSLESAMQMLAEHPIGVLVTDAARDEARITALNAQLKRQVPELVTIVASDRSDASTLINMINFGQVFRFLLKPLSAGQTRLALQAGVNRHRELLLRPEARKRYSVREDGLEAAEHAEAAAVSGLVGGMFSRIRQRLQRSARVPA